MGSTLNLARIAAKWRTSLEAEWKFHMDAFQVVFRKRVLQEMTFIDAFRLSGNDLSRLRLYDIYVFNRCITAFVQRSIF